MLSIFHRSSQGALCAFASVFSAALFVAGTASQAIAQERFPSEPIKIVVPFTAGGGVDRIARIFAEQLAKEAGQPVLIENKGGGGTNIAAEAVARSRPDGYTLLFATTIQVLNPIFGPVPSMDVLASLEPVSLISREPFLLASNVNTPFSNARELLAAAKAAPGKITIGSAQTDMYVELLNEKANIRLLNVPYKGAVNAASDAMGGQIDIVYARLPTLVPLIRGGKLKALAVTSAKRASSLPDVMTFTELGVDYDATVWVGLMAPAGTPKAILDRLASMTEKIMKSPEMVQKARAADAEPVWNRPEEFKALLISETAHWKQVAKSVPQLVQK